MAAAAQFDDADASRRTQLANERTFLAWWRSGLTALGVSVAVGRVVPALTDDARWPYAVVGVGYAVLGLAMVVYGTLRQREVDQGIQRGEFVGAERRLLVVFTVLSVAVAVATLALIVI